MDTEPEPEHHLSTSSDPDTTAAKMESPIPTGLFHHNPSFDDEILDLKWHPAGGLLMAPSVFWRKGPFLPTPTPPTNGSVSIAPLPGLYSACLLKPNIALGLPEHQQPPPSTVHVDSTYSNHISTRSFGIFLQVICSLFITTLFILLNGRSLWARICTFC